MTDVTIGSTGIVTDFASLLSLPEREKLSSKLDYRHEKSFVPDTYDTIGAALSGKICASSREPNRPNREMAGKREKSRLAAVNRHPRAHNKPRSWCEDGDMRGVASL